MRRHIADHFDKNVFYGGLTYNSHPLACAAALATIAVYEEDQLMENAQRMGGLMRELFDDLQKRHPSVGAARNIGLFGIVELVRNRETREPMAPFNGSSPEMQDLHKFFRQEGFTRLSAGTPSSPIRRCVSLKLRCARRLGLLIEAWRILTALWRRRRYCGVRP